MSVSFSKDSQERLETIRGKEEEDLAVILSQKYGIGHINLQETAINMEALRLVPEKDARAAEAAAFQKQGNNVSFALRTPNSDEAKKILHKLEEQGYKVIPHMVSRASLEHAWNHYKDLSLAVSTEEGVLNISNEEVLRYQKELTTIPKIGDAVRTTLETENQYRITQFLEIMLAGALANRASDIHMEPRETVAQLRYRLDGILVDVTTIDLRTYFSALTRIKLLSGLKINITQASQDGRFSIKLNEKEIEIRTSLLPGGTGESFVLRILDPTSIGLPLDVLGLQPHLLEALEKEIRKPNGLILNTGPTGSGKTTMLYAFLKRVSTPEIKVLTIEDPIEYHLEGIVQTQVDHKNYTFGTGLRSALRQDPDIIMVGEIRDEEVATTAIHAALTGHLVFSTLHTNNAAGAFPRLVDIGIQPSMAASAVNVVIAQRLLRKLVPEKCKKVLLEGEDRVFVDTILNGIHDKSLLPENTDYVWVPEVEGDEYEYKGRIGVYEAIFTSKEVEQAIRSDLTIREIEQIAKEQGFLSMREDAIVKVLSGITTLDEIRRVLGSDLTKDS
jgi:type II secretory ATPase GspE/PulE/Tfp pilus assembly ATPase PilB-like protein